MADCYYHGYTSGSCEECEDERRRSLARGTLSPHDNLEAELVLSGPENHPDPTVRSPH